MLSPSLSVATSDGANPNLHRTSSRRRALSYLRTFSQNRSGADSPTESPRISPRSYFQRSTSYTEPRNHSPPSHQRRRRSHSRPTRLVDDQVNSLTPSPDNQPGAASPTIRDTSVDRAVLTPDPDYPTSEEMARTRASASHRNTSSQQTDPDRTRNSTSRPNTDRSTSQPNGDPQNGDTKSQLPTIRFFPHQEIRTNGRHSLNFAPVSRTLPTEHSVIRVGRYSEREGIPHANPTTPSDAPVGFKSKVVSRKHCEFSFVEGQWHVKDVASSSGTFLNHIRLSQPNTESRQFPIKDGDVIQLGIDFRGGEEMIFRCVKIRIECNRAWQKKPNNFNKSRHAQLQMLAKDQQAAAGTNSGECSICLGSVLPCQSLFVAPCAHVWHYKCIRPLLEGKNSTYPQFQCPNCRAYSDLTADVDIAESDMDEWMQSAENAERADQVSTPEEVTASAELPRAGSDVIVTPPPHSDELEESSTRGLGNSGLLARRQAANPGSPEVHSMNGGINMPNRTNEVEMGNNLERQRTRTDSPDAGPTAEQIISGEGPLTPRNNAGPFVFDGSAGRAGGTGARVVTLTEVTEGDGL